MPLQGDLATMRLEELLQWIHQSAATGEFRFRLPAGDIHWRLAQGALVDAQTPGFELWAADMVGEEVWLKARNWAERERTSPTNILIRAGVIQPQDGAKWTMEAGRRSLHTIMLSELGWFVFNPNPVEGQGVPIEHLLLDVVRQVDERQELRKKLGDVYAWLEAVPSRASELPADLAGLLREGVHVMELPWLLADDAWSVVRRLFELMQRGQLLALPGEEPRIDDPVKTYQEAVVAERSFRYEEAAQLFEAAISSAWGDACSAEAVERWVERYVKMVQAHLVEPDRALRLAEAVAPTRGDPYAAWCVRRLRAVGTRRLDELLTDAPFHKFFAIRSVRRLAADGRLRMSDGHSGGNSA